MRRPVAPGWVPTLVRGVRLTRPAKLATVRAGEMRRVLVVDDSAVARSLLVSRLTAAGLEAVDVGSASEALAVDLEALACAVVDVELGPSSGLDLAEALTARSPHLPIAFFTGGGLKEAAHPVFEKPRDLDDLVAWARARCA